MTSNLKARLLLILTPLILFSCDEIKRVKDIPLGTAHSAQELCSRLFISNQNKQQIIDQVVIQKVYPLQWIWKVDIDDQHKTVSVGAPFFSGLNNATAMYRQGQGCTLTHGKAVSELQAKAISPVKFFDGGTSSNYWPRGEQGIHPDSEAYNLAAINDVIEEMFTEKSSDYFEQLNTHAVLVIHDGKLIAERYSPEHNIDNRLLGWSMSKTVTALLLGVHYSEGSVNLEDSIQLSSETDETLKLQHAFNMASGLDFDEGYETQSDIAQMLYAVEDASAYVKSRPLVNKPGTIFYYSTGDTQLLSDVVQQKAGGTTQAAYEFYQSRFFHKLGIANAEVEHDASGTFIGGARMFMRPRDWAKIAQLMLNQGEWNGEQIVPRDWITEILKPSPANRYYGGQVWLHDPEVFGEGYPDDAYALWGVLGQLAIVVPSKNTIVLRMGALGSGLPEDIETHEVFKPALKIVNAVAN